MARPYLVPIDVVEQSAPSTPATGKVSFYAKTDGRFYGKDDTGLEFILGAGASYQADSAAAQTTTVTHNFNTRDVLVQVRRASGEYDYVNPYIEADTVNSVTVDFGEVVSAGAYRILVVAAANVAVFPYDQATTWTNTQTFSHATGVTTNTITERTAAAGVTVDGVLLKDNGITLPALTSGRVPYVSTGGLLVDSSALQYSAGVITVNGAVFGGDGSTTAYVGSSGALVFLQGKASMVASDSSTASARLPHGSAPSSPVNGDMWTTTAGLFVRINGSTVGPLS